MKIERIHIFGFLPALRGMRNPMESWGKSDSFFNRPYDKDWPWDTSIDVPEGPEIGEKDLELCLKLIKAGGAHRKFLRQIIVWWDITIPRAIWQELDTYKVSTVRNSCSTMHKLGSRDLEPQDFQNGLIDMEQLKLINMHGAHYRTEKTPANLHALKMQLTEAFLQMATYTFSYETALHIWYDRHDHRMPEWSGPEGICEWITRLPYMDKFIKAGKDMRG